MDGGDAVSGPKRTTLFNDVHSALHNVTQDLAHFRQIAQENDNARTDEIEALRAKLQQERYEHREQINKFRYEFDELVHQKIEKLIDLIEIIHRNEKKDDREQKQQIDRLRTEMMRVKDSMRMVTNRWGNFANRINRVRPSLCEVTAALQVKPEDEREPVRLASAQERERTSMFG